MVDSGLQSLTSACSRQEAPTRQKVCVYARCVAHGICTDFTDWSIAPESSSDPARVGYDYGCYLTGKVQTTEGDLEEEALNNLIVSDPLEETMMVATSAEV